MGGEAKFVAILKSYTKKEYGKAFNAPGELFGLW